MKKCLVRISLAISLLLFGCFFSANLYKTEVWAASNGKFPVENLNFELTSVEETGVSTASNGQITVIIFGRITGCSNTVAAVDNFSRSGLASMDHVRVIFADLLGSECDAVSVFSQAYSKDMIFCYDIDTSAYHAFRDTIVEAWNEYMDLGEINGGFPLTVLIDGNNMVQDMQTGASGAATILSEVKELAGTVEEGGDNPLVPLEVKGTANYDYMKQVVSLVNEERAKKNISPLTLDTDLSGYAMQRAAEISWNYDLVGHKRPDGNSSFSTVWEQSRKATRMAENIAMGYPSPDSVMSAWVGSSGHYANIMDPEMTSIGVGCFQAADGYLYWVQLFDNVNASEPSVSGTEPVTRTIYIPKSYGGGPDGDTETPGGNDVSISDVKKLTVTVSKAKRVKLHWKKVSGVEGYHVYQYNDAQKTWEQIADSSKVTCAVKSLTPGTSYQFAVKAYLTDKNGRQVESGSYVSVKTSTLPGTVTFKVTAKKKKAAISWSSVNGATGYTVYYKTSAADSWKILDNTTETSYTAKGLTSGKKYYFTVQAYKEYNGEIYTGSLGKEISKKIK